MNTKQKDTESLQEYTQRFKRYNGIAHWRAYYNEKIYQIIT